MSMLILIALSIILFLGIGAWAKKDNERMYSRFYNEALQKNKEKLRKEREERSRGLVR